MKVIHSNNLDNRKVLVEFYELDNYGGESVKLDAGEYNRDQIPLKDIQSMKVAEGAVVTFFTDPGFIGQHVDVTQSVEGGGINFSCVKIRESSNELDDDALDAVVGGRGGSRSSRSSSSNCGADYSGVSDCGSYSCGGAVCGAALCGGATCAADVSPSGVCGGNVCAANTCGVDSCGGNACPAAVCGVNLCPANTCAADVCTVNLLPLVPLL